MRAVRGAITAENTISDILEKTKQLITAILEQNSIGIKDVDAMIFSLTADLTAVYPARAAREMGFTETALFSVTEPDIEGGLPKCIRILLLLNNDREKLSFVYLGGARQLRPDLCKDNE